MLVYQMVFYMAMEITIMTSEVSRMKVSENSFFYDFDTFQIRFAVTILLWFGFALMILIWFQLRF